MFRREQRLEFNRFIGWFHESPVEDGLDTGDEFGGEGGHSSSLRRWVSWEGRGRRDEEGVGEGMGEGMK